MFEAADLDCWGLTLHVLPGVGCRRYVDRWAQAQQLQPCLVTSAEIDWPTESKRNGV